LLISLQICREDNNMSDWLILILSLPTENATARMRVWRALKAAGAAVIRDGVYLLPERDSCRESFAQIADEVRSAGGKVLRSRMEQPEGEDFAVLFDRSGDYRAVDNQLTELHAGLEAGSALEQLRQLRKLRKQFLQIAAIDFFPDGARAATESALNDLERVANRLLSPDEPVASQGAIPVLNPQDYQGKLWATRRRPWVDRLASAWLIVRFIDPKARFAWLASPADCPADALGFDFDGARFTHVGERVSFEVLIASFDLGQQPALVRMAGLVHYLDVGGARPPEAAGIETLLAGLRDSIADDDQLLAAASAVFDGLLVSFGKA
jgi:hypothetical protein